MDFLFNLTGPQFLILYVIAIGVSIFACFQYREYCRRQMPKAEGEKLGLDPYEVAYLRNQEKGLVDAVVTKLLAANFLEASTEHPGHLAPGKNFNTKIPKRKKKPAQQLAAEAEQAIIDRINGSKEKAIHIDYVFQELTLGFDSISEKYKKHLTEKKVLLMHACPASLSYLIGLLFLLVLGAGFARMLVGVGKGNPIGFLFVLNLVCFIGFYWVNTKAQELARPDQSIVEHYQSSKDRSLVESEDPQMVTWAVSLYGPLVLTSAAAYTDFMGLIRPKTTYEFTWSCGSGTSGSSYSDTDYNLGSSCGSSCGGGGGGCGGCGG